ncbi:DUF721 domain-containing protein [Acinetobacter sp. c2-A9]
MHNKPAFEQLKSRVHYWQKLTALVSPILPKGGEWQVVYYEQGVLIIAGKNSSLNSQVRYLQQQFLATLQNIPAFNGLNKIQIVMRTETLSDNQPKNSQISSQQVLTDENRQYILTAASIVGNDKLSQSLQRLASRNSLKDE